MSGSPKVSAGCWIVALFSVLLGSSAFAGYRILFKDGRIIEAQSKPVLMEGHFIFRTVDGNTLSLPTAEIDLPKTEAANSPTLTPRAALSASGSAEAQTQALSTDQPQKSLASETRRSSPANQKGTTLDNKDVLEMVKVGLTPEIVLKKIETSSCKFDTSPQALRELKEASVPDSVILGMVQAPANITKAETQVHASAIANDHLPETAKNAPPPPLPPRDKKRNWQLGKVLDVDVDRYLAYTGSNTEGTVTDDGRISASSSIHSTTKRLYTYAIEADQFVYVVSSKNERGYPVPTFYAVL